MSIKVNEIQTIVFKILCDIDDYCRENNIMYFLSGGSCLGAVRHKGFIPWDDDADIMIPRHDFKRFIGGFEEKYKNKYGVGSLDNNHEWKFPYGRVWDLNTQACNKNFDMESIGVFVDVFPIDGLPDEEMKQKDIYKKIKKYNVFRHAAMRIHFKPNERWKLVKIVLGWYCKKKGARYYAQKMQAQVEKYTFENSKFVAVSMACHYGEKETIEKRLMDKSVLLEFNEQMFPVPVGYKTYLSNLYGDYMSIPKDAMKNGYTHLDHWEININKEKQ